MANEPAWPHSSILGWVAPIHLPTWAYTPLSHATVQLPPFASSLLHHKNPQQIVFMVAIVFIGRSSTAIIALIDMAHSTDCTRVRLSLFGISDAFHLGSLLAIWSTKYCSCDADCFLSDSGNPRYFIRKDPKEHWRALHVIVISSSEDLMGRVVDLLMLVLSPAASSNSSMMH